MVKYCCAPGCLNSWNPSKDITFHRFPHKRPDILSKWVQAIKIKNFNANMFALVCSEHFTKDSYMDSNRQRKMLKREAVPTIFNMEAKQKQSFNESARKEEPLNKLNQENNEQDRISTVEPEHSADSNKNDVKEPLVMEQIKDGWFREINEMWPGQHFALKVDKVLAHEKSDYQDVLFLQTSNHGKALVLDGIIQCTEHDEFSYQEMIAFLPLCAHPNPAKVLIVGGGDGGVAREVDKHPLVKDIVQVEIDQKVIDLSKKYLPGMAKGFDSSKLTLKVCDGFDFLRNHKNEFDVIITDSSDPIGPATNLFTDDYYRLLKEALKSGGVMCSQAGSIWVDFDQVKSSMGHCHKHFAAVKYAYASVPTYPTGQIGFVIGSLDPNNDLTVPKIKLDIDEHQLKYYSPEIHTASFALPAFALKNL